MVMRCLLSGSVVGPLGDEAATLEADGRVAPVEHRLARLDRGAKGSELSRGRKPRWRAGVLSHQVVRLSDTP